MDDDIELTYLISATGGADGAETYQADLRLRDSEAGVGEAPITGKISIPEPLSLNTIACGKALSRALFTDDFLTCYGQALVMAARGKAERKVRLQLIIDKSARRLNSLRWETLIDPFHPDPAEDDPAPPWLAADRRVLFSRFLGARELWDIQLAPHQPVRALVAIASPTDLPDDGAARGMPHRIEVEPEIDQVRLSFGDMIKPDLLYRSERDPRGGTFGALFEKLRGEPGYHILYLVCHGSFEENETLLLMEGDDGRSHFVRGSDFVHAVRTLEHRPLLVVLAVCQSAGTGNRALSGDEQGILAALGPKLVQEAGVAACLAMQGRVIVGSAQQFMGAFFSTLTKSGRVDEAVAAGRIAIATQPDRWVPVLFTRLRGGRLWYTSGFDKSNNDDSALKALASSVASRECLAFVGPGLARRIMGTPREVARALADSGEPLHIVGVDDLAQVAQMRATRGDRALVVKMYAEQRLLLILERCRDRLQNELRDASDAWERINPADGPADLLQRALRLFALLGYKRPAELHPDAETWVNLSAGDRLRLLDRLTEAIGRNLRPSDPHRVLARKRLPIYVTTRPDRLLEGALMAELAAAGVTKPAPESDVFRWCGQPADWPPAHVRAATRRVRRPFYTSVFALEEGYEPSPKRPLVYHLFGRYDMDHLLVLTEDDYFECILAVGAAPYQVMQKGPPKNMIVTIKEKIIIEALMFLGFQVDDWDFRVLFRTLFPQEVRDRKKDVRSIAVQIAPEGAGLRAEAARSYFAQYYGKSKVSVFWGEAEDLIARLETA